MFRLVSCLTLSFLWGVLLAQIPSEHPGINSDIENPRSETSRVTGSAKIEDVIDYKPFTVEEKLKRHTANVFGPVPLAMAGVSAGYGQLMNSPHEWGQGTEGFAKRYASAVGTNLTHAYLAFGMEATLHEDPRYFPSLDRSAKGRIKNALRQVYMCRRDDGTEGIAYARLGSAFGAGMLADFWQPRSTGAASQGVERSFIILGADAGMNVAEEFIPVLRHITHH